MKKFTGFEHGMGIGGWLTNYKRFNVLPDEWRMRLTIGDYEHFDSYITHDDVKYIASLGMDHIRLGFDQIVLEEAENPGVYREHIFDLIKNFVSWCKAEGLNVVLNLHKAIGNYCDIEEEVTLLENEGLQDRFVALWLKLEESFADNNSVVFELLNEVRDVEPALWNKLAARTITALRAVNPQRKIMIGSTCWNDVDHVKYLDFYDDENIFYTFHFYQPFEFTHQRGVLQSSPLYYNRKLSYPDDIEKYRDYFRLLELDCSHYDGLDVMDIKYLRRAFASALEVIKEHPDKIFYCGEFGTIRHADITSRENWMHDVISILKENDIPYCVWNYLSTPNDGNRFSLVDDDTRKILSERMAEIIR